MNRSDLLQKAYKFGTYGAAIGVFFAATNIEATVPPFTARLPSIEPFPWYVVSNAALDAETNPFARKELPGLLKRDRQADISAIAVLNELLREENADEVQTAIGLIKSAMPQDNRPPPRHKFHIKNKKLSAS